MSRAVSSRGRHLSSPTSLDFNFYACYGEYTQQYIVDRRLSRQKDSTLSLSSAGALETAQIEFYLKKPELRSALNTEKQQRTSTKEGDKMDRSFSSLSEGHGRNSRVIMVYPAKKPLRKCRSSTQFVMQQTPPDSAVADPATSKITSSCDIAEISRLSNENSSDKSEQIVDDQDEEVEEDACRPKSDLCKRPSISRTQSISELFWQGFAIDGVVYCGAMEAAHNSAILCRLNIEYIVDLSGVDDKYLKCRRNECPCPCARINAHTRMMMTIDVVEEDPGLPMKQDLIPCFGDFIAMVNKAKARQKCVLVFSRNGRNRAPAFSAAYLMHEHRYTRIVAIKAVADLVPKTRPGICISDTLQRALMRWQRVLGIRRSAEPNKHSDTKPASIPSPFVVKRTAWM